MHTASIHLYRTNPSQWRRRLPGNFIELAGKEQGICLGGHVFRFCEVQTSIKNFKYILFFNL